MHIYSQPYIYYRSSSVHFRKLTMQTAIIILISIIVLICALLICLNYIRKRNFNQLTYSELTQKIRESRKTYNRLPDKSVTYARLLNQSILAMENPINELNHV